MKPYGNNVNIAKLECVGHVQKRMGSRLRRLKTSLKGSNLSDGKSISGKNRLTDSAIDRLQNYYGLAIRQNVDSVENMKKAVWAVYFHTLSTNEEPSHELCPAGADSWCKFNKGKVTGVNYNHPHSLPRAIMDEIKPIFRDLAHPDLLKKCLHGRTQNPNECVNSRIPKTVFVGINTLHFGVFDAVATFNQGNDTKCQVLQSLGLDVGENTVAAMWQIDKKRIQNAETKMSHFFRRAQQHRGTKRKVAMENEEDEDDPSYGAGLF